MRDVLNIPVAYHWDNTLATAFTLNLSKGGLGVRTMSPLDTGTKIRVRFRLPGSDHDIEADSRVAWSDRLVGMGLQFEHVTPPINPPSTSLSTTVAARGSGGWASAAGAISIFDRSWNSWD